MVVLDKSSCASRRSELERGVLALGVEGCDAVVFFVRGEKILLPPPPPLPNPCSTFLLALARLAACLTLGDRMEGLFGGVENPLQSSKSAARSPPGARSEKDVERGNFSGVLSKNPAKSSPPVEIEIDIGGLGCDGAPVNDDEPVKSKSSNGLVPVFCVKFIAAVEDVCMG